MIGKRVEPIAMARDACAGMTEQQRLAFATELLNSATSPQSQRQLRCVETVAREARIAIARDEALRRQAS